MEQQYDDNPEEASSGEASEHSNEISDNVARKLDIIKRTFIALPHTTVKTVSNEYIDES